MKAARLAASVFTSALSTEEQTSRLWMPPWGPLLHTPAYTCRVVLRTAFPGRPGARNATQTEAGTHSNRGLAIPWDRAGWHPRSSPLPRHLAQIKTHHLAEKLPCLLSPAVAQPGCSKWPEKQHDGHLDRSQVWGVVHLEESPGSPLPAFSGARRSPSRVETSPKVRPGRPGGPVLLSKGSKLGGRGPGLRAGASRAQPCLRPDPGCCRLCPGVSSVDPSPSTGSVFSS